MNGYKDKASLLNEGWLENEISRWLGEPSHVENGQSYFRLEYVEKASQLRAHTRIHARREEAWRAGLPNASPYGSPTPGKRSGASVPKASPAPTASPTPAPTAWERLDDDSL